MYKTIELVSRIKNIPTVECEKSKDVVIAGDNKSIQLLINEIKQNVNGKIRLKGYLFNNNGEFSILNNNETAPDEIDCGDTLTNLEKIEEIIITEACKNYCGIFKLIDNNKYADTKIYIPTGKYGNIPNRIIGKICYGIPLIHVPGSNNINYRDSALKRALDLVITIPAFILLLPLIIMISVLIKLTSRGPVFYKSERVGYKGKYFIMYKFRTMKHAKNDDEERKKMMLEFMKNNKSSSMDTKIVNICRITKVGKFLRKTSLDELPQLINVIKGEMSLVGPRPCIPYEFENYEEWQKSRSDIIPGCTGLWQISGRSKVSFDESVFLDLLYKYSCSFLLDVKIILRTIPVMIFSHGGR